MGACVHLSTFGLVPPYGRQHNALSRSRPLTSFGVFWGEALQPVNFCCSPSLRLCRNFLAVVYLKIFVTLPKVMRSKTDVSAGIDNLPLARTVKAPKVMRYFMAISDDFCRNVTGINIQEERHFQKNLCNPLF